MTGGTSRATSNAPTYRDKWHEAQSMQQATPWLMNNEWYLRRSQNRSSLCDSKLKKMQSKIQWTHWSIQLDTETSFRNFDLCRLRSPSWNSYTAIKNFEMYVRIQRPVTAVRKQPCSKLRREETHAAAMSPHTLIFAKLWYHDFEFNSYFVTRGTSS